MIEILDKINNEYKKVPDSLEIVIHPLNGTITHMRDMILDGNIITGVIFKEDGTTMILYKKEVN